jgi:hypothetical protein
MSVSTCAQSSAIAPAARKERAEMSEGRNPTDGPIRAVEQRRTAVMSAGRMGVTSLVGVG